jgi:hypothetical protein
MSTFFDFDPVTGVRYDFAYNEDTGDALIHRSADVEGLLRATHEARATGSADKNWKRDMPTLYAEIDPITITALLKKGIDIFNLKTPAQQKAFFKEIETNYPMLKCTEKKAFRV